MTVILDYKEFVFGTEKLMFMFCSDAGRWKTLGVPVVICGDNLSSLVGIGWTDLPNIGGGGQWPPCPPPVPASLLWSGYTMYISTYTRSPLLT